MIAISCASYTFVLILDRDLALLGAQPGTPSL